MTSLIMKYPLDLRGNSANNLVLGEVHDLSVAPNRIVVTNYGPFFLENLEVFDHTTGLKLERDTQWRVAQLYQEATVAAGKDIYAVIVIVDPDVSSSIRVNYQVVGGKFSRAVAVIKEAIDALEIDERAVEWGAILSPPEAFPPVSHLHDAGDLYGFEYLVAALDEVRRAILIGDEAQHDALRRYTDNAVAATIETLNNLIQELSDHRNDKGNPHEVSRTQLDVYSKTEVNTALAGKLNKLDPSVDSNKFDNRTYSQAKADIRANLDASLVTSGRFNTARLGSGTANSGMYLAGDGTWKNLQSAIAVGQTTYFAGQTTLATVKTTYAGYPIGTIVGFHLYNQYNSGGGNASTASVKNYRYYRVKKVSSTGWSYVG